MMGFITRVLILVMGYIYPAYDCYKTVELNKPEIDQLRFWCQYWILLAIMTVLERVADNFVSWLPMYSELKLAFIVYLWYPKSKGTTYVYNTFFQPYLSNHEAQIDQNLNEMRTLVADWTSVYFQKVSSYGQTRFYEVLQYVASQAPSGSGPVQPQRRPQHQQPQQGSGTLPQTPNTNTTSPVQPPPVPVDPRQLQEEAAPSNSAAGPTSQQHETVQTDGGADVANGEQQTVMEVIKSSLRRRIGLAGDVRSGSSSH